ncbi:hypothetical protein [Helicobacter sp. MIT 05-5294]|uniref:hypothetical protein n=1 Tax=Helicobacter sp. MIT 05-5294 TaxID=1548150 RepID=UPI0010FD8867|nr:hypothetical protein [Helicobacter sp. MIT 05-5294]TLD84241.1 hypothetical protein LS69_009915 [Helicobacter sp. MIT 05-5294]
MSATNTNNPINTNTNNQNYPTKTSFITKLKDKQTTIKIPLDTTITKDKYNNINLQDTKLLFLSFIPFKDNDEANNTKA